MFQPVDEKSIRAVFTSVIACAAPSLQFSRRTISPTEITAEKKTMVMLLVGFVLGVIVGASSWLLVAAWLESRRVGGDPERSESDLARLLPGGKSCETRF